MPQITTKNAHYAIVDNVFEPLVFQEFWKYFNGLNFANRQMTGWQKVWRISDGTILAGAPSYRSQAPFHSPMDMFHHTVMLLAQQHFEEIVGKEDQDWGELFFTPYIYAPGSKISWHDDHGYSGACIFYTHPVWGSNWGGELMLATTPDASEVNSDAIPDIFCRDYIEPILNHYGLGVYIAPKPNRMVFTAGKMWHSINRVDQTAGEHCRCSIVGFFSKEKLQ